MRSPTDPPIDWASIYDEHGQAMRAAGIAAIGGPAEEILGKSADDIVGDVLAELMTKGLPEAVTNLRGYLTTAHTEIPSPSEDPVARRFGFHRAGQDITIDGRKIASLRKSAGIDLKDLATRVATGGGTIAPGHLFRLDQGSPVLVSQPTASALVAALNTSFAEIEAAVDNPSDPTRRFLDSPAFEDIVKNWADEHDRNATEVMPVVADRVLAAQYRADDVTAQQLLAIINSILDNLEP